MNFFCLLWGHGTQAFRRPKRIYQLIILHFVDLHVCLASVTNWWCSITQFSMSHLCVVLKTCSWIIVTTRIHNARNTPSRVGVAHFYSEDVFGEYPLIVRRRAPHYLERKVHKSFCVNPGITSSRPMRGTLAERIKGANPRNSCTRARFQTGSFFKWASDAELLLGLRTSPTMPLVVH